MPRRTVRSSGRPCFCLTGAHPDDVEVGWAHCSQKDPFWLPKSRRPIPSPHRGGAQAQRGDECPGPPRSGARVRPRASRSRRCPSPPTHPPCAWRPQTKLQGGFASRESMVPGPRAHGNGLSSHKHRVMPRTHPRLRGRTALSRLRASQTICDEEQEERGAGGEELPGAVSDCVKHLACSQCSPHPQGLSVPASEGTVGEGSARGLAPVLRLLLRPPSLPGAVRLFNPGDTTAPRPL